jgi:phosphate transport system substrate-binding protein
MQAMHGKAYTTAKTEHETTREVVSGVAGDLVGIGFGGMGPKAGVKVLALSREADSPPVTATVETVQRRAYPLAHYLYFGFPGQPEGPARNFLAFVISAEGQRIVRESQTGLVPLPMSPSTD